MLVLLHLRERNCRVYGRVIIVGNERKQMRSAIAWKTKIAGFTYHNMQICSPKDYLEA
ncbi:unnamed protein product [Brassica rapa subsp. trilocularis]